MKSIFLVWKDKNCNGENPEWIYMKANEFFEFKKLPENADRRFVQVGDKKSSLDDTVIFIEANEELYKKSNAEQSRKSRISKTKKEHPLTLYAHNRKNRHGIFTVCRRHLGGCLSFRIK